MFKEYFRLGELLVQRGLLNEDNLAQALAYQKSSGSRLGEVLTAMGWITEENLGKTLADQYGYEFTDLDGFEPDHDALQAVSGRWSLANLVLPMRIVDDRLEVAIADPVDVETTDDLRSKVGMPLIINIATATSLRNTIIRCYTMEMEGAKPSARSKRGAKIDHQADREAILGALDRLNRSA